MSHGIGRAPSSPIASYVVGTADSVLIREVYCIQSVLYTEVPLYT